MHVGLVLPGFIATEGFPGAELLASVKTRWLVGKTETVAEAILDAGPGGRAERYAPRPYMAWSPRRGPWCRGSSAGRWRAARSRPRRATGTDPAPGRQA